MSQIFNHIPHPRLEHRRAAGPPRAVGVLPAASRADRFNTWLAIKITGLIGTMWCAYVLPGSR